MCLAGTVVASLSLIQEVGSLSPFNDKYFSVTEFAEFSEHFKEKLQYSETRTRPCGIGKSLNIVKISQK